MRSHTTKLTLVILCAILGLSYSPLHAVTRTIVATGNWASGPTWLNGQIPATTDDVDMNGNTTVTVSAFNFLSVQDISTGNGNGITINSFGSLTTDGLSAGTDLTIIVNGALIIDGNFVVGDRLNLTVNGIFTVTGNMNVMNDANITVNGAMGVGSFNGLDRVNINSNGIFVTDGPMFLGNDSTFDSDGITLLGDDLTAKDRFTLNVDGVMGIDGDLTAGAGSTSSITTTFFSVTGTISGPAGFGALTPLPISLAYFEGQATEEGALLSWETLAEESNAYFTIEKSRDGVHFEELARVKGAGDSDVPLQYKYLDKQPYKLTYYRLRQTDYDGTFEVFNIVTVSVQDKVQPIKVFPTIVRNRLVNVELPFADQEWESTLIDMSGRVLSQYPLQDGRNNLELPGRLPNGMYILRIYDPVLRTSTSHQIIVQE
jgi:hypothetical protein